MDIYDPITEEIRSSSTDDIACCVDTNYNSESFFVRHAYFTGADQPSQGKNGKPGKITVKLINHYGDEVLKVYEVK